MYRGGFFLLALFAALLIAATVHPASRLSPRVFALPVVVWVGVRSYGIYLWHWPIYMVTRPHADVPFTGIPLLVLRLALTVLFATVSYKYVEEPIRHGALGRRWGEFRRAKGERRRQLGTGFAVAGSALVAGVLVIVAGFLGAGPTPRPPGLPTQAALVLKPDHHHGRPQRPHHHDGGGTGGRHRGHHHARRARGGRPRHRPRRFRDARRRPGPPGHHRRRPGARRRRGEPAILGGRRQAAVLPGLGAARRRGRRPARHQRHRRTPKTSIA